MPGKMRLYVRREPAHPLDGKGRAEVQKKIHMYKFMWIFLLILHFLHRVVGLDGLGLYDHTRVTSLPCLRAGCDRPCHIAGLESEGDGKARQQCRHCRCHNLVNLFLAHNSQFSILNYPLWAWS